MRVKGRRKRQRQRLTAIKKVMTFNTSAVMYTKFRFAATASQHKQVKTNVLPSQSEQAQGSHLGRHPTR